MAARKASKRAVKAPERPTKIDENRVRRMAQRQGYTLHKSRRRDPRALDYGVYWLDSDRTGVRDRTPQTTLERIEAHLLGTDLLTPE